MHLVSSGSWWGKLSGSCEHGIKRHVTWYAALRAFAKLRNATVGFGMSVCLFVRIERLGSHWTGFHEIWHLSIFRKSLEKFQVWLKSDKETGTLHKDQHRFLVTALYFILRVKESSDKSFREERDLQPAKRTPLKTSRTKSPTHNELRTIRPMW